ncbi:hypothetical protein HUS23_10850 [Ectothiorhodospiraceae bacterium 2226]|nr:hypothetical protein HUS23_10850 [Ectothiorhodospiraceae bacterium 2226]
MDEHAQHRHDQHHSVLWAQWLVIGLGAWLVSSPAILGYGFGPVVDPEVARVTAERGLPDPELRNRLMAWSDFASGLLIMIFGALALSQRHAWAPWANTGVALWLLLAPMVFWVPSAAAYANTTLVAALVIGFSILLPMMPGMRHEAMMQGPDVPPGWTYCPSTYLQQLPIIALVLIGFLLARHLAAY